MHLHKLNENAHVIESRSSEYALYVYGDLMAVSNVAGDILMDELHQYETSDEVIDTVDQFVELMKDSTGADNPNMFFVSKKLLNNSVSINNF